MGGANSPPYSDRGKILRTPEIFPGVLRTKMIFQAVRPHTAHMRLSLFLADDAVLPQEPEPPVSDLDGL